MSSLFVENKISMESSLMYALNGTKTLRLVTLVVILLAHFVTVQLLRTA